MREHGGREQSYGGGSITDGHCMLRIRIGNFNDEHDLAKGDHVRIKGYMHQSGEYNFFVSLGGKMAILRTFLVRKPPFSHFS